MLQQLKQQVLGQILVYDLLLNRGEKWGNQTNTEGKSVAQG